MLQLADGTAAGRADVLAAELHGVGGDLTAEIAAARGTVLAQDDGVALGEDLKGSVGADAEALSGGLGFRCIAKYAGVST